VSAFDVTDGEKRASEGPTGALKRDVRVHVQLGSVDPERLLIASHWESLWLE
jgi:hypothetical protein